MQPDQNSRLASLVDSLDCLTEQDVCILANTTESTVETWRKRGKGPAYVLIGNRFLYPRQAVSDFLKSNLRERRPLGKEAFL